MPGWYVAADVFVMPNRSDGVDFEGFGIVFLEAAAGGNRLIGGRSGGLPEAVADGVTGLLVDGGDLGDLEKAMAALAASRRRAQPEWPAASGPCAASPGIAPLATLTL